MTKPFTVGITGGSGSGKTYFLQGLSNEFKPSEICLVSQDHYYQSREKQLVDENGVKNFDVPEAIDRISLQSDISKLKAGHNIVKKEYTFNNPNAEPRLLEIKPAPIVIVEGLFILHFKEISELLDLKIFIDTHEDIALQRRLKRDLLERGYPEGDVLYKWNNHVVPAYKTYLLPYKDDCDEVITNNSHVAEDIIMITDEISERLRATVLSSDT